MKKFFVGLFVFFVMLNLIFSEDNNSYWTKIVDNNGQEVIMYLTKTETQFKNNFPYITKKKFNIDYDWQSPEYEKIYGSFINPKSDFFKKNYPKVYKSMFTSNGNSTVDEISEEYKYLWFYVYPGSKTSWVMVFKRNNNNAYMSICSRFYFSGWNYSYTYEFLDAFETLAP